jgi:hypothetical protein
MDPGIGEKKLIPPPPQIFEKIKTVENMEIYQILIIKCQLFFKHSCIL